MLSNLPVLPMGTIMAACMLFGVLFAARLPVLNQCPKIINNLIGLIVLIAGVWNVFWYAIQHLTEFWGFAALASGVLMIITSLYLLAPSKLPAILIKAKPVILVLLLGYGLMYAITIVRL